MVSVWSLWGETRMEPYIAVEMALNGTRQRSVGVVAVSGRDFYGTHSHRSENWLLEAFYRPTDYADRARIMRAGSHAEATVIGKEILASGNVEVAYTLPEFRKDRLAWLAEVITDQWRHADEMVGFCLEILVEPTATAALKQAALDEIIEPGRSGDRLRQEASGSIGTVLGKVCGSNLEPLPEKFFLWMDAEPQVLPSP